MDEFVSIAGEMWATPEIQALTIVLASLVAGKVVDLLINRLLRGLAGRSRTDLDDRLIERLHRPVYVSVVLIGLYIAVSRLGLGPPWERITIGTIQTLALLMWTATGLRVSGLVFDQYGKLALRVQWLDVRTAPLFKNVAKILIMGAAIYSFLLIWRLDVKPWLASAGIVGIAIGFAAKDSLANVFSGLFIIVDAPYKIGDFINLDTGERGRVTQIGLRSTRLLTRDDVEITLPNGAIGNAKIINESGGHWEKSRISVNAGVAYGSDIDEVREVLTRAAESVEYVLDDPPPAVRFSQMGDSALIFKVMCWISEPVLRGRAVDGLNTAIYKSLAAAKITIPFPQRDVHLYRADTHDGD